MKCREDFLVIPTFIFTKCTSVIIQITLERHLKPRLLKSTIFTPTFSYKAERKVAENASRWLERQQVVASILPLCKEGAAPDSTSEPGQGSQAQPGSAALRSVQGSGGWQKS